MLKFLLLFLFSLNSFAFDHSHKMFDQILSKYLVKQGKQTLFNYKMLKKDAVLFEKYLKELSDVSKKEYQGFSQKEKLAFLINAYNAFTLKIIVKNYPVDSIKDIGSFLTNTWKIKFFKLLGEETYLDKIEHEIIRKDFNEPRIHFAVNCASIGCPSLYPKAFVASKLNQQLDDSAKNFILNTKKNRIENNELKLSKIFKWYGSDFDKTYGSFYAYIAPIITSDKGLQKKIQAKNLDTEYLDYDWNLNEIK